MKTWLLIDGSYMGYRAFFTTGGLSHAGELTGVAYGFLRDIENLVELFGADCCVFAFDHRGQRHRNAIEPTYKANRKEKTPEEVEQLKLLHLQMDKLKAELLPMSGYRNIIEIEGYEADDIIAVAARDLEDGVEAVIVSTDNDLLQCLTDRVVFYNPTSKKLTNSRTFRRDWGIVPEQWADVKALAGCKGDNVKGIEGIGEKSAAAWFTGKLKTTSKKFQAISSNIGIIKKNLPLVKLPYPGCVLPKIVDDEVTDEKKSLVKSALGMRPAGRRERVETGGGFW